ncbi:hypothetical protein OAU50_06505 [Planctomycetota bacterium]|nr:hypothetical protein [Planctomycetota bacterium]
MKILMMMVVTAAFLMLGCGGDNSTNTPEEFVALGIEDAAEFEDKWLAVEATDHTWKVNGEEMKDAALADHLTTYAKKVDPEIGLKGMTGDSFSKNPIVFKAQPRVRAIRFLNFLSIMAGAGIPKVRLHLPLDGVVLRRWIELPIDLGLGKSRPKSLQTGLQIREEGGDAKFEFSFDREGWRPVKFDAKKVGSTVKKSEYVGLRESLDKGFKKHFKPAGEEVKHIEINFRRQQIPTWSILFAAIDSCLASNANYQIHFTYEPKDQRYKGPEKNYGVAMEVVPEIAKGFPSDHPVQPNPCSSEIIEDDPIESD